MDPSRIRQVKLNYKMDPPPFLNRLPETQKSYPNRIAFYDAQNENIILINDLSFIANKITKAEVETYEQEDYVSVVGDDFHYYFILTPETRKLLN